MIAFYSNYYYGEKGEERYRRAIEERWGKFH